MQKIILFLFILSSVVVFGQETDSIKSNTSKKQLLKGKIVDGRNRQEACRQLAIEVKTKELDSTLSQDEVKKLVKSLNIRRNLTNTQKVMSAVKDQKLNGGTNTVIATSWGIAERTLKNGKYIAKNKPEFVNDLYIGKSVKIIDHTKGYEITSNKITTIARLIKSDIEKDKMDVDDSEEIDISFAVEGLLKSEQGKQWFYNKKEKLNLSTTEILMDYVELANHKYKLKEEV